MSVKELKTDKRLTTNINKYKLSYLKGRKEAIEKVKEIVKKLNIKYPSQNYGTIGNNWNTEFNEELDKLNKI